MAKPDKKKTWDPYRGKPPDKNKPSHVGQKAMRLSEEQWEKALAKLEKLEQNPRLTANMMLQGGHLLTQLIEHGVAPKAKQRAKALLDKWSNAGKLQLNQIP